MKVQKIDGSQSFMARITINKSAVKNIANDAKDMSKILHDSGKYFSTQSAENCSALFFKKSAKNTNKNFYLADEFADKAVLRSNNISKRNIMPFSVNKSKSIQNKNMNIPS